MSCGSRAEPVSPRRSGPPVPAVAAAPVVRARQTRGAAPGARRRAGLREPGDRGRLLQEVRVHVRARRSSTRTARRCELGGQEVHSPRRARLAGRRSAAPARRRRRAARPRRSGPARSRRRSWRGCAAAPTPAARRAGRRPHRPPRRRCRRSRRPARQPFQQRQLVHRGHQQCQQAGTRRPLGKPPATAPTNSRRGTPTNSTTSTAVTCGLSQLGEVVPLDHRPAPRRPRPPSPRPVPR